MEFNEYNILIAPSSEIFKQTLTVMLSAMLNCKKKCHFFIMQFNWTKKQKDYCINFVAGYPGNHVDIIDVNNDLFYDFKSFKNYHTNYYKLLAHNFIPDTIERVIHLEPDMIIRKDIGNYYSEDFNDNFFVAVNSIAEMNAKIKNSDWHKIDKSKRHLRASTNSNPGVLLINLKKFRDEKIDIGYYKRAIAEMSDNNYWFDEGIINFLFWDKRKYVHAYKYQTMIRFVNVHKNIFKLNREERKAFNEDYWDNYNETEALSIIHFVIPRTAGKPWECYYDRKSDKIIDTNGQRANLEEEAFYKEWWNIAKQLPLEIYEEFLLEAYEKNIGKGAVQGLENQLTWARNANNFFEKLGYDYISNKNFERYFSGLNGKSISVLKDGDSAGRFLLKCAETNNIRIAFSTKKSALAQLTPEEWEKCRNADVIINCCVHGSQAEERDGIKDIMIFDIMNISVPNSSTVYPSGNNGQYEKLYSDYRDISEKYAEIESKYNVLKTALKQFLE